MDEIYDIVDTVILRDGVVYISPIAGVRLDTAYCRVGEFRFEFRPSLSTISTIAPPNLLPGASFAESVPLDATGDGVRTGKNIGAQWTLSGHDTAFIEMRGAAGPVDVRYLVGESDLIPIQPNMPMLLQGRFAAHRAKGTVELKLFTRAGKLASTQVLEFSDVFQGGREIAGYYEARFHVPPRLNLGFISLTIHCRNERPDDSPPGYVFIADLSLRKAGGSSETGPFLVFGSNKNRDGAELLECEVPTEAFIRSQADLHLEIGDQEAFLYSSPRVDISASGQDATSLTLATADPGLFTLYIDGVYSSTITLDSKPRQIPFNAQFFDGDFHQINVRDAYGLVTHYQDYTVLPESLTPFSALQRESSAPFPSHLATAARFRYTALQKHLSDLSAGNGVDAARVLHAHNVVERGFDGLADFEPLVFPQYEKPQVSIVIPVHNKANVTYFCLCALILAWNKTTAEVIVVDDGSSDRTLQLPDIIEGVTFIRHEIGQGFVRACNKGATAARGDFIIFLNNDTEPTCGWIDELLIPFQNDAVGLVGSKLLYPDGRLQEAGGIVWRTGNPWNYGRLANPWDPRFCYSRRVDYVSGAALMVRADLWRDLGGFSSEFVPAYFEDTDLAFKALAAGYFTHLAAQSIVFHFEGVSSGTDIATGAKQFQEVNRPKFKQKWAAQFRTHGEEGILPDLEKDRGALGRVAFLDHGMPRPDFDAGGYAAVQEMRLVQSLGFKVTFVPDNVAYMGRHTLAIQRLGVEALYAPFVMSILKFIEERGSEFDAFYITRYDIAERYTAAIRQHAPRARVIFNNADLHFLRLMRAALLTSSTKSDRFREAITVRDRELEVMRKVDLVLSYNETEHAVILSHNLDSTRVLRCPWVAEIPPAVPDFGTRSGISFLGGFRHPPNAEAVNYFLSLVMPLLRQQLPGVCLHIYGSAMPESVKAHAGDDVVVEGYTEDVSRAYDRHRVFVAPLLSGAGIKGKVIGAMASGTPSVLSSIAAEGIGVRDRYDVRVASDPAEWVDAICQIYEDRDAWEAMSARSRELVAEKYSFAAGKSLMRKAFQAVDLFVG